MKNTIRNISIFMCAFALLVLPMFALAQGGGPTQTDGGVLDNICENGVDCDFDDLLDLVKNVLDFIFLISIPVAAGVFAYAGFLMITAVDDSGKISKAKEMFFMVLKGFIFILAAWLIVRFITSTLLNDNAYIDFLGGNR